MPLIRDPKDRGKRSGTVECQDCERSGLRLCDVAPASESTFRCGGWQGCSRQHNLLVALKRSTQALREARDGARTG